MFILNTMQATTKNTIREMYRLAYDYRDDAYYFASVDALFNYVKNLPYVDDMTACGAHECLKRPRITAAVGGDCDDKAIYAGAALYRMQIPFEFVTQDGKHVYIRYASPTGWKKFDATYSRNNLNDQRVLAGALPWRNNYLGADPNSGAPQGGAGSGSASSAQKADATQWFNYLQSVTGPGFREAVKSGQAQLALFVSASTVTGNPVVGVVAAALYSVLTFLGGVPGRNLLTPQQGYDISQKFRQACEQVMRSEILPHNGKVELYNLIKNWFDTVYEKYKNTETSSDRYYAMFLGQQFLAKVFTNATDLTYARRKPLILAWEGTLRHGANWDTQGETLWAYSFNNAKKYDPRFNTPGLTRAQINDTAQWKDDTLYSFSYALTSIPITMLSQVKAPENLMQELELFIIPKFMELVVEPFTKFAYEKLGLVIKFFGFNSTSPPPIYNYEDSSSSGVSGLAIAAVVAAIVLGGSA